MTRVADDAIASAAAILQRACGPRFRRSVPVAPLTSFRIGGPAALYLEPETDADLEAASVAVRETGVAWYVIGKGSNLLVSDAGFPGLLIRLGRGYRWASRDGDRLHAGASIPLPALAGIALAQGLSGLEFVVAIPGSLGGGVRMNAGVHGASMQDVLVSIDLFSVVSGGRTVLPASDAEFAYRRSALPPGSLVVGASARLRPADRDAIRASMDDAREWRRRTQPLAEPNCGSVFKNPPEDHAARLVEAVGGKDLSIGGAAVSRKHSNFIVTTRDATATDVLTLIRELQRRVADRFDVELEMEVQIVGDVDVDAA